MATILTFVCGALVGGVLAFVLLLCYAESIIPEEERNDG